MPISPAAPNFPLDVRTGAGIRAVREGAAWRFDLNDEPILTTGTGAFFQVATEAGRTKLRNGLTVTIQADREFLGVPYVEIDDNAPVRWVDVDGTPLARVVVGRVYRISYDLAQDVMRSDVLSLVNNANLGPMAGATLKGNAGATPGGPQDIPLSLLAAPGNPIGDEIKDRVRFEEAPPLINERVARSQLYRRKVRYEVPLCPGFIQDALVAAGHSLPAYPTGIATNHATNDLWVCESFVAAGGATKGIICGYDITNRASPVLKTWWYTGQYSREGIVYREIGGRRYLDQLGDSYPFRTDITAVPLAGSSPATQVFTSAFPSYFEICWTGSNYIYMARDIQNPGALPVKAQFIVADTDFNKVADLRFPFNAIGSYFGRIQDYGPKCQGIDWSPKLGAFVLGCGGDYRPTPARLPEYRLRQSKQQGLIICGPNGDIITSALCDPEVALALTGAQIGRAIAVHECEGVRTDPSNGKLYAIWQTLAPDEWATVGRTRGVVITEELCTDDDAVDYAIGATALKGSFDGRSRVHVAPFGRQLTHPILGTPITDIHELADMAIECSLLDTYFSGYNTPLTDLNGVSIPHANGYIRASYSVSANFRLEINFQSGGTRTYSFGGMGGIFHEGNSSNRTQVATPVYDGPTGIRYCGGASPTVDPVAAAVDGISIDPAGIVKMHRGASTALGLGRGAADGYSLTLSRAGALIGGLYHIGSTVRLYTSPTTYFGIISGSPEGVAGGGVGSVLVNILNGDMYTKKSGGGNIGWAL